MSGPPPIITLTTDFGLQDAYLAAMKGAILSINPTARIIDVSHAVRPQAIEQAAFVLAAAWPYFPPDAIHVVVVDPAVGSERRALALRAASATFVGPDNGVLSAALPDEVRAVVSDSPYAHLPAPVGLPTGYRAVSLTNERFFRTPVSSTFHGRDIFGPVAAHLSLGADLEELGEPVEQIVALPPFRAHRQADGSLRGRVLHIDAFGNLITDVRLEDVPSRDAVIEVAGRTIEGVSATYEPGADLRAVTGSSGYLEIAAPGGSAAALLNAGLGLAVVVRQPRGAR
jgi:S-adenosylmethionine hydrolase